VSAAIKLSSPATREFWEIPVLHEDADLLALDKPAGLLTSPDRIEPNRLSLMKLLHTGIAEGKPWAAERGLTYLMNAHRLDFETSGVLLLARNKAVLVSLANLFGSEKPAQKYIALVQGVPAEDRFEVNAALTALVPDRTFVRVDPRRGKRARTVFQVRERFASYTLVECQPLTSRIHQVRAHLRYAGLPIVGDEVYGGKMLWLSRLKRGFRLKPGHTERPLLSQAALHAEGLALAHPVTGQPVDITSPAPKVLVVALKYLRRYGVGDASNVEREIRAGDEADQG
jgi:RluA family pseudouridine synthase